jgi:hypothetical protein
MSIQNVFQPAATASLAVTTVSAAVAIPGPPAAPGLRAERTLRLFNDGAAVVFVSFGGSGVTASATGAGMGVPLAPGSVECFRPPQTATHVAGVTAAGAANLYVTPGEGE